MTSWSAVLAHSLEDIQDSTGNPPALVPSPRYLPSLKDTSIAAFLEDIKWKVNLGIFFN